MKQARMKQERDPIAMHSNVSMTRFSWSRRFVSVAAVLAVFSLLLAALPAAAQNLYAPVAKVNDRVVTRYELDQRARFLTLLRAPGDPRTEALKVLIDERLEMDAATRAGVVPTDEEVQTGMEEFASRAKLTSDQFIAQLAKAGVAKETYRDFVRVGLAWREVVRSRFVGRIQITDAEIDRALAQSSSGGGLRVLLTEIILPAPPEQAAEAGKLASRLSRLTSFGAFSSAARQYSASRSRGAGGRLPWMALSKLPPRIRGQILALKPGQVTAPIPIPNGIVLFQMRAIEETDVPEPKDVTIQYAKYLIDGGKSPAALARAAAIQARVDNCDDLYGINKGQAEERLQFTTLPLAEIPQDVAIELAKLDDGEVSTQLTSADGKSLVLLMLCGRTPQLAQDVSRDDIRQRLGNQRLQSYAEGYLAQLRADAAIETLGQ